MGALTQYQINVDLFDEVKRLKEENKVLRKENDNQAGWIIGIEGELRIAQNSGDELLELANGYLAYVKKHDDPMSEFLLEIIKNRIQKSEQQQKEK